MASIQVDDKTAKELQSLADSCGKSVQEYLAALVGSGEATKLSDAEFESELTALTHHGPSLPADFSRADIYADHD